MAIDTRVVRMELASLRLLEKNARFMPPREFEQLVSNVRKDGALTSLPLVYRGEVLSGNHRVQAAIKAGLVESDVIEIVSDLTTDERTAIQLSHNAISGRDDQSVLRQLYDSIGSLDEKLYSGLSDDSFQVEELNVSPLSFIAPTHEEIILSFLPEDKAAFISAVDKIAKTHKKACVLAARMDDFDQVFSAVIEVKAKLNIINSAEAFKAMALLALARLESVDAEKKRHADAKV